MRLSRFNQYIEGFPEPGDTLIYNHLSGGMVPVTAEGMALLRRIDQGEPATETELAEVEELRDPGYGVLVEGALEDERRFAERMDLLRKNKRHLSLTISTSLACNFGCSYCLQDGVMSGKTMSLDTTFKTGRWIVERMRAEGVQSVDITFLGGEPLLHPHVIESISRQVGKVCREDDVRFSFNVTTNGWFLTRAMAERLKALGCTFAKVTLDGDETTHDLTRPQKNGKSSFWTIWNNLVEASKVLPIHLVGNYSEQTLPGFEPLIRKLKAAGFGTDQIQQINFLPALLTIAAPESAACKSPRISESNPLQILELSDRIRETGYRAASDSMSQGPCGFHNANHFGIDPEGYVYKCVGFFGMPKFAITTVTSQELGPLYQKALSPTVLRECSDCGNRPSCAGGCVASAWINAGEGEVSCDKPYFSIVGVEAIRRKWRREQQGAEDIVAAA